MRTFAKYVCISLLIGGILFVLLNLPMQLVRELKFGAISFGEGEYTIRDDAMPLPVAAGWPETFYRRYHDIEVVEPFVSWSQPALMRNIAFGFGLSFGIGAVAFLLRRSKNKSHEVPEPIDNASADEPIDTRSRLQRIREAKIRFSIFQIFLLTSIVALPLGYYQWHKRLHDIDLKRIQALGYEASFVRETLLPAFVHDWVPSQLFPVTLRGAMMRTTMVRLIDPADAQVVAAMSMPHLRALVIGGGDYDLERLASLPNRDALTVLHLNGRELDDRVLSRIRLMDNLRSLSFHRTNISETAIERLYAERPDAAARLRSFNLVDTGVDLTELSDSETLASMVSLNSLFLPRPIPGNEAEFTLPSMPKLNTLSFLSQDRGKNASLMKVTIADCPELAQLRIGMLQKVSLKLTRLPKLKAIESYQFKTTMRLGTNQSTPGVAWIESIVVDDLPLFEELKLYASDLKEMRFTKTPNFKFLGPGVFQVAAAGFSSVSTYDERVPDEATKALVQGLAVSDGPEVIDYAAVPIGGADLAPLLTNTRLSELYLHQCGLKVSDIRKLQGSETLRTISTQGNELGDVDIGTLISKMPKLERWRGDLYTLGRLRLEDHEHIQGIVDSLPEESNPDRCHLAYCSAIRLINLPNWGDPIRLDADSFRHITIQNLPKLTQLIINGPMCEKAVLSGLSGLRSIAIGGELVDDRLIADWSGYEGLSSISLHGTSITPEGYRKLLAGRRLARIDLRNARVDDAAILATDPTQLASVSFRGTDVTEASVRHVLKSNSLGELNVSGIALSAEFPDRILEMNTLRVLGFDATGWTPGQLRKAAMLPILSHLILSNIHIDVPMSAVISAGGANGMSRLTLIDSTADGPAVTALMNQLPELKLHLVRTEIPAILEGDLFAAKRLIAASKGDDAPYCRGPDGMSIPIMKRFDLGGGAAAQWRMPMMFRGIGTMGSFMGERLSFAVMPDEQFERLSPEAFEVVGVLEVQE